MLSLLNNIHSQNRADSPQGYAGALEFESTHPLHTPLGKLSKWPWLYPPSTPHFIRTAHLLHPLPKSARLWGVHWHRIGRRLVGCTLRIHLQTV